MSGSSESISKAEKLLPPEPVFLISTISSSGVHNLAPQLEILQMWGDYFILCVGSSHDTFKNIEENGELVISVPPFSILEKVVSCGKPFPPSVSEFSEVGLTPVSGSVVSAPLVKECVVNFECKLSKVLDTVDGLKILLVKVVAVDKEPEGLKTEVRKGFSPIYHIAGGRVFKPMDGAIVDTGIDYKTL